MPFASCSMAIDDQGLTDELYNSVFTVGGISADDRVRQFVVRHNFKVPRYSDLIKIT